METKRHILFLSSWFPSEENPFLGNFVERHLRLIAQQNQVTFLNLKPINLSSTFELNVHQDGNLRTITVLFPAHRNPLKKWWNLRKAFRIAIQEIHEVDIIHGNVMLPKGIQFVWAKKQFQKPLIITEHASYFEASKRKNWRFLERITIQQVIQQADLITAVSPFLQTEIEAAFPRLKVELLPNVIDERIFKIKSTPENQLTRFVHISTLDERYKNVGGILESCLQLKMKIGSTFQLLIISDESYEKWQQKVKLLNLEDCVSFAGPMNSEQIAIELQKADASILFSSYETFSCVVAESWATGTPVISTPVGIAKNLKSTVGIQVQHQDIAGLTQAMLAIVQKEQIFNSEEIRQEASSYFQHQVLERIEAIYQAVEKR